ncbi:MAG: DUF2062 domain-containing protein [Verrucomicrobiae bacterium]
MKKLIQYFASLGRKLLELRDTPHAIAGGVAIGVFIGFTPLFFVKTLLCLCLAYLFRCSKIAAVIAVSLHDVVTPFWPVLLKVEYDMGAAILSRIHEAPAALSMHHLSISELMKWTTFLTFGVPMLIGSIFISAPTAAIAYAVMLRLVQFRERRRAVRAAGGDAPGGAAP